MEDYILVKSIKILEKAKEYLTIQQVTSILEAGAKTVSMDKELTCLQLAKSMMDSFQWTKNKE